MIRGAFLILALSVSLSSSASRRAGAILVFMRAEPEMKVVGRRRPSRGGLAATAPFLDLVIRLRRDQPFIPRGLHRFRSFEESQAWSMKMMARRSKHVPPA